MAKVKAGFLVGLAFIGSLVVLMIVAAGIESLGLPYFLMITLEVCLLPIWFVGYWWLFFNNEALKE